MFNPIIHRHDLGSYFKNRKKSEISLQPTPENRALIAEYKTLEKEINEVPERLAGLRYNHRSRDLGAAIVRLTHERDAKVARLLYLEKIFGFTK